MKTDRHRFQSLSRISGRPQQRGASIIAAVFLLLLMAVLAAAITSVVSTAHVNTAADIGGARAYQAARAGVEWGIFQLDPNAQGASLPACVGGTLDVDGHSVEVTCSSSDYSEAGRSSRVYRVVSKAVAQSVRAPGIERQVEATIEKCRDPVAFPSAPYGC